jgi:hypothetical protein
LRQSAAPRPSIAELLRAQDSATTASAGPFDRDTFEDVERERIAEANRQLAARDRQGEESRRR